MELLDFLQEPLGGAHADPYWTSQQIKTAIVDAMAVSILTLFLHIESISAATVICFYQILTITFGCTGTIKDGHRRFG